MIHVTAHAIQRYRERVADVTEDAARTVLSGPVFQIAVQIGAGIVRLGTGHRAVIDDGCVITVLPVENYRRHLRRIGKGRYG